MCLACACRLERASVVIHWKQTFLTFDKKVVLVAVSSAGWALQHASEQLRGDDDDGDDGGGGGGGSGGGGDDDDAMMIVTTMVVVVVAMMMMMTRRPCGGAGCSPH